MIVLVAVFVALALLIVGAPSWLCLALVIGAGALDARRTNPQRRR